MRLTWRRVVAAVVGAVALAALVALLDWLRPAASRTHLGEFVESVLTGEAGAVVGRKVAQNLSNLGSPPLLDHRAGDGGARGRRVATGLAPGA